MKNHKSQQQFQFKFLNKIIVFAILLFAIAFSKEDNPYKILGVNQRATDQQIKSAFRKLSLKYHPDKNSDPAAGEFYAKVTGAYETLKDKEKRKNYDMFGSSQPQAQQNNYSGRQQRSGFGGGGYGGGNSGFSFSFGSGGSRRGNQNQGFQTFQKQFDEKYDKQYKQQQQNEKQRRNYKNNSSGQQNQNQNNRNQKQQQQRQQQQQQNNQFSIADFVTQYSSVFFVLIVYFIFNLISKLFSEGEESENQEQQPNNNANDARKNQ